MGQNKNEGDPFLTLAEECSEVIQVITKKYRFDGTWDDIPPGHTITRREALLDEMIDVSYQIDRVLKELQK